MKKKLATFLNFESNHELFFIQHDFWSFILMLKFPMVNGYCVYYLFLFVYRVYNNNIGIACLHYFCIMLCKQTVPICQKAKRKKMAKMKKVPQIIGITWIKNDLKRWNFKNLYVSVVSSFSIYQSFKVVSFESIQKVCFRWFSWINIHICTNFNYTIPSGNKMAAKSVNLS